jgi:hypothetical protein
MNHQVAGLVKWFPFELTRHKMTLLFNDFGDRHIASNQMLRYDNVFMMGEDVVV